MAPLRFEKKATLTWETVESKGWIMGVDSVLRAWDDLVEMLHHTDPVIAEVAVTTIAEHHFNKGKLAGLEQGMLSEAHWVLLELLEEHLRGHSIGSCRKDPSDSEPGYSAHVEASAKDLPYPG
jgi:hypothetical protein